MPLCQFHESYHSSTKLLLKVYIVSVKDPNISPEHPPITKYKGITGHTLILHDLLAYYDCLL
jgi:hypothetical protein